MVDDVSAEDEDEEVECSCCGGGILNGLDPDPTGLPGLFCVWECGCGVERRVLGEVEVKCALRTGGEPGVAKDDLADVVP
jgi:hypothetical protein